MNDSKSLGVLATLRDVAALLTEFDMAALPEICAIQVSPDFTHGGLSGKAQLAARHTTELGKIEAIRTWAVALGGVTLLGDEYPAPSGAPYRKISAVVLLPSGALFEVWDHVHDLHPEPGYPADSELIAA